MKSPTHGSQISFEYEQGKFNVSETVEYFVLIDGPDVIWPQVHSQGLATATRPTNSRPPATSSPASTSTSPPPPPAPSGIQLTQGAIIGIGVSVFSILASTMVAMFVIRRMHRKYAAMAAAAEQSHLEQQQSRRDDSSSSEVTKPVKAQGLMVQTSPLRSGYDSDLRGVTGSPMGDRSASTTPLRWDAIVGYTPSTDTPPKSAPPTAPPHDPSYLPMGMGGARSTATRPSRRDSDNSHHSYGYGGGYTPHLNASTDHHPSLNRRSFDNGASSSHQGWVSAAYLPAKRTSFSSNRSNIVYRQQLGMIPNSGGDAQSVRSKMSGEFERGAMMGGGLVARSPSLVSGSRVSQIVSVGGPVYRKGSDGAGASIVTGGGDAGGVFNDLDSNVSDDGVEVVFPQLQPSTALIPGGRTLSSSPSPTTHAAWSETGSQGRMDPVVTRIPSRGRSNPKKKHSLQIGTHHHTATTTASPSSPTPSTASAAQALLASRRSASLDRQAVMYVQPERVQAAGSRGGHGVLAARNRSASRSRMVPPLAPSAGASPAAYGGVVVVGEGEGVGVLVAV
ncbi:hypothetical protein HDU67_001467 [Dinochytrium kinnereticum]|nr:hypothetical protein HDU67_001467 [Dinochytrium kinnereticum]